MRCKEALASPKFKWQSGGFFGEGETHFFVGLLKLQFGMMAQREGRKQVNGQTQVAVQSKGEREEG